jgi:hypothetical protein
MEFMEVVRERYSCKDYDSSRQVEKEKLDAILEAGSHCQEPAGTAYLRGTVRRGTCKDRQADPVPVWGAYGAAGCL